MIDRLGGTPTLEFLVNEGDALPKKGSVFFRAGQTLKAGSNESINIKLWEGSIQAPITDNRFIGVLKIRGTDIDTGIVPTGADIECEYEMSDSGTIMLEVSIPCIGATFSNRNFYSRQEGQMDLSDVDGIAQQGREILEDYLSGNYTITPYIYRNGEPKPRTQDEPLKREDLGF